VLQTCDSSLLLGDSSLVLYHQIFHLGICGIMNLYVEDLDFNVEDLSPPPENPLIKAAA
jgi:hypothetical protein